MLETILYRHPVDNSIMVGKSSGTYEALKMCVDEFEKTDFDIVAYALSVYTLTYSQEEVYTIEKQTGKFYSDIKITTHE